MSDQKSDDDQRLDELLLRLLRTPPQPRTERKRPRAKSNQKPNRTREKRASAEKSTSAS